MDYSDRRITMVAMGGVNERTDSDGATFVTAEIRFGLADRDGNDNGPLLVISMGVPSEPDGTIRAAELALLSGAIDLLNRGWKESAADLHAMFREELSLHVEPAPSRNT